MVEKYEYHKQNDYPGERIAERERVADRAKDADKKSDARVAKKNRIDEKRMDSEIQRNAKRAARINRKRDTTDKIGMAVIAGLIVIMLTGSVWGFVTIQKQSDNIDTQSGEIDNLRSELDKVNEDNQQLRIANNQIFGKTDTNPPTIVQLTPLPLVSPANNEMDVAFRVPITVVFSEDMDPSTINTRTFTVEQRTTPEPGSDVDRYRSLPVDGTISYSDRKATFTSDERLSPSQLYGNVFTVTLTKDVKDIAGNSLQSDYIWSFTTGNNPFNTGPTTSQTG